MKWKGDSDGNDEAPGEAPRRLSAERRQRVSLIMRARTEGRTRRRKRTRMSLRPRTHPLRPRLPWPTAVRPRSSSGWPSCTSRGS